MEQDHQALTQELKEWITQELGLRRPASDIGDDVPLFGKENGGLGIDSLDALQLASSAEVRWGVKLPLEDGRHDSSHPLASVRNLARFIASKR